MKKKEQEPDEALIKACIAGKKVAQYKLYEKYVRAMYCICLRYSATDDDANDILQEGFIKVFNSIHTFRFSGSFEGWVKRIMINTALEHIRKNSKNYFVEIGDFADMSDEENGSLIDEIDKTISPKDLTNFLQKLPDGYRQVFNMYVFEDYTHREIAQMLDISENTSKSQLARARYFLQKEIKCHLNKLKKEVA